MLGIICLILNPNLIHLYEMPAKVKMDDIMLALVDPKIVDFLAVKTSTATALTIDELFTK